MPHSIRHPLRSVSLSCVRVCALARFRCSHLSWSPFKFPIAAFLASLTVLVIPSLPYPSAPSSPMMSLIRSLSLCLLTPSVYGPLTRSVHFMSPYLSIYSLLPHFVICLDKPLDHSNQNPPPLIYEQLLLLAFSYNCYGSLWQHVYPVFVSFWLFDGLIFATPLSPLPFLILTIFPCNGLIIRIIILSSTKLFSFLIILIHEIDQMCNVVLSSLITMITNVLPVSV